MHRSRALAQIVLATLLASGAAPAVHAQARAVKTPAAVLASPRGRAIGSVRPGVELRVLETRGSYVRVSVDGYVERARLSAGRGTAATRVGRRNAVIRSRGAATARSVASLDAGTTVTVRKGTAPKGWVRVSRTGWILGSALAQPPAPATQVASAKGPRSRTTLPAKPPAARAPARGLAASHPAAKGAGASRAAVGTTPGASPATPGAARTTPRASTGEVDAPPRPAASAPAEADSAPGAAAMPAAVADSALVPTSNVALRAAPDARALGTIAEGTVLTPLARERGWVRVRIEGWVPERDVTLADSSMRSTVSAADLRADPQGSKGRVVRWSVQVLARQTSDPLRRDLAPDETYLLARGPGEENALLYLVVPPSLLESTKSIPALSEALVTARVRTGKSELVGVPILDLLTIATRK